MSYVHCHNCGWGQDDFYNEHYNPASYLKSWDEQLYGKDLEKIDEPFTEDSEFLAENGNITTREVIAREYEKFAQRIRNMKWITYEQFLADPNKKCPKCGSSEDLDLD